MHLINKSTWQEVYKELSRCLLAFNKKHEKNSSIELFKQIKAEKDLHDFYNLGNRDLIDKIIPKDVNFFPLLLAVKMGN